MEALGLIETKGFLGAIVAADVSVKAANVSLINAEKIKGGYVTVQLDGDVGAVKAAVAAATEAIEPFGNLVSSHVIPRMHTETTQLINTKKEIKEEAQLENQSNVLEQSSKIGEKETESLIEDPITEEKWETQKKEAKETTPLERKDLEQMTVQNLRKLVREKNIMKDDASKIKNAKKSELINGLLYEENKHQND